MPENKILKLIIKFLLSIIAIVLILGWVLLSACWWLITIINIMDYNDYSNILLWAWYLILWLFFIYLSDIIHKKYINKIKNNQK